jgi:hypothetical protein
MHPKDVLTRVITAAIARGEPTIVEQRTLTPIISSKAKHAYDVQVKAVWAPGRSALLRVEANSRTQASFLARKAGWEVMSVNMVG